MVTPWATILDGELVAIRARHAAQLAERVGVIKARQAVTA